MSDFPTLSQNPDAEIWREEPASDPTLRSEFEAGYQLTRAKFTVIPRTWSLVYRFLSNTEKTTLQTFERSTVNYGANSFNWTNPIDSQTYVVRFVEPIKFTLENNKLNEWQAELKLVEANPTSS
jgi:hypothetical protein